MEKLVLPLAESNDVALVGGKAASLARLISAGFNVPAGFVVTSNANDASESTLKKEVLNAFDELGAKLVAVRSSAVAEDGSKDAWAGQMDTFLNVARDNLIESVKKCQESAKSDRAQAYAKQKGLHSGDVAVIVQKMIPSEISGVAFSAHPVTNNREQIVIEAISGLGEKLVSGTITPDTYIVSKQSGTTVETHVQSKKQTLAKQQIQALAEVVAKIEMYFGFPVDVEWAYANEKLFILQSRPITTLG